MTQLHVTTRKEFRALIALIDEHFGDDEDVLNVDMRKVIHSAKRCRNLAGFEGIFPSASDMREGKWTILIARTGPDDALVFADQYFGPLAGAGYLGWLKRKGGRWLVLRWFRWFVS